MKKMMKWLCCMVLVISMLLNTVLCYSAQPPVQSENLLFYYDFEGENPLANKGSVENADIMITRADYWRPVDASEFNGTTDSKEEAFGQAAIQLAGRDQNSYMQLPEQMLTKCEDAITISFWYKGTEASEETSCPVSFCGNGVAFYICFEVKDGAVQFFYTQEGDDAWYYVGTNTVSVIGWHMYTVTVDKGETTDSISYYVDGTLVGTHTDKKMYDCWAKNQIDANCKDFYSGLGGGCWSWPLADGAIDEFRIYDCAFSAEQVTDLYSNPFEKDPDEGNQENQGTQENEGNAGTNEGTEDKEDEKPITGDVSTIMAILAVGVAGLGGLKLRKKNK